MITLTQRFSAPDMDSFSFAGFDWPRMVAILPRGTWAQRLQRYKNLITGPYWHAPRPGVSGTTFYLDSDGAPDLRWAWCDDIPGEWDERDVPPRIGHTGWFTDEYGDGELIRGVVFKLPKSRGYLAGWSMGVGMISEVDYDVYLTPRDAALAADSMAENAAERQREFDAEQRAELEG